MDEKYLPGIRLGCAGGNRAVSPGSPCAGDQVSGCVEIWVI